MKDIIIFLLILILSSIGYIATDIYLPSMPDMVQHFETSNTIVQLTFSVYMFSFCVTPFIVGPISDNIGRKIPILYGLYVSLIATFLCIFAYNIYFLIFARFLQGIGTGMIVSTSRALLPDYFEGEKLRKYFSYISMFMALILAIAPPLGGMIQDASSWRIVFVTMFFYLTLVLILVKLIMKDYPKKQGSFSGIRHHLASYKALFANQLFMLYTVCTIFTVMGVIAYLTVSPFLLQSLIGLSATEYGFTALSLCGIVFISGFINSRMIHHFSSRTLLISAIILILLSGSLLFIFNQLDLINTYTLLIPALIYFASMPLSISNAAALALNSVQGNYGAATALMTGLQFMGGGISSLLISLSNENSLLPLGICFLVLGLLYMMALMSVKEKVPLLVPNS